MVSLQQIESDLVTALKAKDQVAANTLRGLKTRIQNEKIAKMKELGEADLVVLVRSEIKRRKDAAEAFTQGGRQELAEKELQEAKVLEKYLPAQMPEEQVAALVDKFLAENSFTAKDFGVAMGKLKSQVGAQADGATLAKLLKEKLS